MKKKQLFAIALSCIIFNLSAQNSDLHEWRHLQNQGENFYTIQQQMETKYEGKSSKKQAVNYSQSYKQYKRWEYYWQSRIDEKGNFVSAQRTLEEANKLKQKPTLRSTTSNWSIVGPITVPTSSIDAYGGMGRINCVAWEVGNTNHLYVGSPSGGLWKSINGGVSWIPLTDNQITLGVSDVVVSHANANVIYLATGDADGQQNASVGVLKSVDGGNSWNQTGLVFQKPVIAQTARMVQHPIDANTLLVTATDGIYKTIDGGDNWLTVSNQPARDIEYDPNNPMVLYASGLGVILKSIDGGDNWLDISPSMIVGVKIELALTQANSNYILALDDEGTLMASNNAGATWSLMNTFSANGFTSQGGYNLSLAIAPINQSLIMAGGVNGWRSTDGGATWEKYLDGYWSSGEPYFYVHSDHHIFKFLPNSTIMLTGNDGGLHRGDAALSTPWVDLSSGLAITQYYGLGADPINNDVILAGAQDNDAGQFDGTTWFNRAGPSDGIEGLIDPTNPTMVQYASTQAGGLLRTDDGWATDSVLSIPASDCGFVWPMQLDPINSTTIYAGCDEIYKSIDKGDTWTSITNGISSGGLYVDFSLAPSNPSVIYAVYDANSLIGTTNGGTTWSPITSPIMTGQISGIAIAPTNPQKIWITYAGYAATDKVFVSSNGGQTWTNITGTLPNIPVTCIIAQSGSISEDIYIGTDLGVFHKNNTLSNWQSYNTGLPNVIVNDLEITYSTGKLRAATFGRGVWESDLNSVASSTASTNTNTFDWQVSPNPTHGIVQLNLNSQDREKSYQLTIYNLIGGVVYHRSDLKSGKYSIDLSSYSSGVYMLTLGTKEAIQTQKVSLVR